MTTIGPPPHRLESETWARFEGIIRDFEKALQHDQSPKIDDYLVAEGDGRLVLLSELVHAELEHWLKAGKAVRVESYLTRFPDLRDNARTLLALIVSEYRFRQELEGTVTWQEFATRFPELTDQIRTELAPAGESQLANGATDPSAPAPGTVEETRDQPRDADASTTDAQAPAPANGQAFNDEPGTRIGPYQLLCKIGQGGMGAVYLAEQTHPVRRQVALKVIRAGLNNAHVLARFESERQSLAMMDHLNIAKVLDVGATEGRRPYFVMELVQGVPLTNYCEENALSIRERLALFVMVCQGIQHAHQKGVIHRDIKPSNVLVTIYENRPVPKVIDFGLAKATEHSLSDDALTEFGTVLGTLDYMSPEQADGNAQGVDTRSDVYSLGVLLYELLTGAPPLDRTRLRNAGFTAILKMIKEDEPPRPSIRLAEPDQPLAKIAEQRKTEPAKLVKLLRSELDWIALKALEKDRNRRYETASSLAQEVQRYLADEPVEACPPSMRYRMGKFARKHRALLATVTGIAALLLLGIGGLIAGIVEVTSAWKKEQEAGDKAVKALGKTNESVILLFDMIRELIPKQAHFTDNERLFFDRVLKQYESLADIQDSTPKARQTAAEVLMGAAAVRVLIGQHAEAEAGYRQAIQRYTELVADFPNEPLYRDSLGKAHNQLGLLLRTLRKPDAAESHFRQALALHKQLAADFPEAPEYRRHLAGDYHNLGLFLRDQEKFDEAQASYDRAVDLLDPLTRAAPDNLDYRLELARCHLHRGILWSDLNKPEEAQRSYALAMPMLDQLVKDFPNHPECGVALADAQIGQGNLLNDQGKPMEAKDAYVKAAALLFRLYEQYPAIPDYRSRLAGCYTNLGDLFSSLDQPEQAKKYYVPAINLGEQLTKDFPAVTEYQISLAATCSNYANCFRDQGKQPAAALDFYSKSIALLDPLPAHDKTADVQRILRNAYWDRADALGRLNRRAEAKADWQRALTVAEDLLKANLPKTAAAVDNYFAARAYSLASAAFKDDAGLHEQYVTRALALLKQARTLDYFQDRRRIEQMNGEHDFDPLREEAAFKKFVAELAAG